MTTLTDTDRRRRAALEASLRTFLDTPEDPNLPEPPPVIPTQRRRHRVAVAR